MKISEQIKEIAKHNNVTITELAALINTSQGNLANKLTRDNFKLSDIEEIVAALGYTDMEIVLRGNKQDAIINSDSVKYRDHDIYMMFDENQSLLDDIHENGFRNKKFKDLVFELLEPHLKARIGNMWNAYVPKDFEEGFKQVMSKQLPLDEFISKLYGDTSKKD